MAVPIFDIDAFLDYRGLSAFNYKLIILSTLITVFDGFDMMMISFTAPYMRDQLHLDPRMLGNLFSAGVFGTMVGGFFFSWLGDRIGRRAALLFATFLLSVLTFVTGIAASYEWLLMLRFAAGLALGGLLPLAWALNVEFVPSRVRSTVVTVIMLGYSIGAAVGGPVTVLIAPRFGWPVVYFVGGVCTLSVGGVLCRGLPESLRFLVIRGGAPTKIAGILKRVAPEVNVNIEQRLVLRSEVVAREPFNPMQLFKGPLVKVTPLLWIGYLASTLAVYFGTNWGPIVLESMSFSRDTAAYAASITSAVGAALGLLLMRFTDRKGPIAVAIYPLLAVPALIAVGFAPLPASVFLPLEILGGVLVIGAQFGIVSIASIYYPTGIRASGGGWATSVAKIGGITGPILGGVMLASGIPAARTFALLAGCPLILGLCAFGIARVVRGSALASTIESVSREDLIAQGAAALPHGGVQ